MNKTTYALFSTPLNKKIIANLESQGNDFFLIPDFQTETLKSEIGSFIKNVLNFDWIIFSDIFTVDHFIEVLRENDFDLFDLDSVRICSAGEATADKLRFSEIHSDIIAPPKDNEKVVKAIENYISGEDSAESKILILKEFSENSILAESLQMAGFEVVEARIYQIKYQRRSDNVKIKALLLGGAIDEVIISSASDFIGFRNLFGNDVNFENYLKNVKFSAADEIIFQMLQDFGLKPRIYIQK